MQQEDRSAVVFDLDGVLVDSEGLWDAVRRGLAADSGRPWPQEATRAMLGMNTAEWSQYLVDVVGVPGPPEQAAETVIDRMAAAYAEHLPLLPGATSTVTRLAARWPLGLATSSPPRLIDVVLRTAGVTECFAAVLSTEDVEAGKPSPAVYRTVVEQLGADPARTVAIEDSTNGVRAAAGAGLAVIAVPRPDFPPSADALALTAARVDRLDDVTVELVERVMSP